MQPNRFGFGDEIADREYQSVIDDDAVAGALGAQRVSAEGIGRDDGVQTNHRGEYAIQIKTVIAGARLVRGAALSILSARASKALRFKPRTMETPATRNLPHCRNRH